MTQTPKTQAAEQKRLKIQSLYTDGHTKKRIAELVGVTQPYVQRILKAAELVPAGRTEADKREHRTKPISPLLERFGQNVTTIRHMDRGYGRDDLAAESKIYIGRLARIEGGLVDPTLSEIKALAVALEVEISALIPEE